MVLLGPASDYFTPHPSSRKAPAEILDKLAKRHQQPMSLKRSVAGLLSRVYVPPPPFKGIRRTPVPRDPPQRSVLLQEIDILLSKRAIVQLPNLAPSGFYSTSFLTPKKSGELRPILNLNALNKYIRKFRMDMETLRAVVGVFSPHQRISRSSRCLFAHTIDPESQKWLHFALRNKAYQFQVLPFAHLACPRHLYKNCEGDCRVSASQGHSGMFTIGHQWRPSQLRDVKCAGSYSPWNSA